MTGKDKIKPTSGETLDTHRHTLPALVLAQKRREEGGTSCKRNERGRIGLQIYHQNNLKNKEIRTSRRSEIRRIEKPGNYERIVRYWSVLPNLAAFKSQIDWKIPTLIRDHKMRIS